VIAEWHAAKNAGPRKRLKRKRLKKNRHADTATVNGGREAMPADFIFSRKALPSFSPFLALILN
jgi:hypothetical protein